MFALVGRKPRYPKFERWFHVPVIDGSDGLGDTSFDDFVQPVEDHMDTNDDVGYPTEWHSLDTLLDIDVRQFSADTYQLRSPSHTLILNTDGFSLYRDHSPPGVIIFEDWCKRHGIDAVPRSLRDLDGTDYES